MFWDNIIKFVVIVLVVILFSAIFIPLYKNIERFVDAQETQDPDALLTQYSAALKPITDRLCPLIIGIETVIVKNANTTANTNPTMGDAKRAAQDAKNGDAKPLPQPPPSAQDMEKAFQRMLLEAQHLLISCPIPTNLTILPPTTAEDLGATLVYIYGKTAALNKQIQSSLNGDLSTGSSSNNEDPLANMNLLQRETAITNYNSIVAQYNENNNPRTVALTPTELSALLEQRISTLNLLKAQVDPNGNNYVDAYLASIEREYAQLQKAEGGELKPGPDIMSSPSITATS
jgi:hypothetical protein